MTKRNKEAVTSAGKVGIAISIILMMALFVGAAPMLFAMGPIGAAAGVIIGVLILGYGASTHDIATKVDAFDPNDTHSYTEITPEGKVIEHYNMD